jgi:hypothetical protein
MVRLKFHQFSDPNLQMECIYQDKFRDNNRRTLEIDRAPALIFQIVDPQHSWIYHLRKLRQDPFETREKRRIIKSPFRSLLIIPLLYGQTIRDGQPIPMDLEICGFAVL